MQASTAPAIPPATIALPGCRFFPVPLTAETSRCRLSVKCRSGTISGNLPSTTIDDEASTHLERTPQPAALVASTGVPLGQQPAPEPGVQEAAFWPFVEYQFEIANRIGAVSITISKADFRSDCLRAKMLLRFSHARCGSNPAALSASCRKYILKCWESSYHWPWWPQHR